MNRAVVASAVLALGVALAAAKQTGSNKTSKQVTVTPGEVRWSQAPNSLPAGAQLAVLEGDPGRSGPFTIRLKLPAKYKVQPHSHPTDERLTVIEGTFYLGMGETFDQKAAKAYPAGSFLTLPKGTKHFAFSNGGAVIQISGQGPWDMKYVHPEDDPRRMKGAK